MFTVVAFVLIQSRPTSKRYFYFLKAFYFSFSSLFFGLVSLNKKKRKNLCFLHPRYCKTCEKNFPHKKLNRSLKDRKSINCCKLLLLHLLLVDFDSIDSFPLLFSSSITIIPLRIRWIISSFYADIKCSRIIS